MYTVSARLFAVVMLLVAWSSLASAHPVAQGSMDVEVREQSLLIRAQVSAEEVLVAATGGRRPIENPWRAYGEYLRSHLHVRADDVAIAGAVISAAPGPASRPTYVLEYRLPRPAQTIRISEDSLHEIEYAPGNRWEAAYLVTVHPPNNAPAREHLLTLTQPLEISSASTNAPSLAFEFFLHGLQHILSGFDHLLFVAALVLGARGLWDLVKVISAFTVAHTVTLTLATLDIVRLPPMIVEPAIAASIVIVAAHNLRTWKRGGASDASGTWVRMAVAFFFGLFHGLGFAGGLIEAAANMRAGQLATALASFSVGVECGQQLVVIPVCAALYLIRRLNARAASGRPAHPRYNSGPLRAAPRTKGSTPP